MQIAGICRTHGFYKGERCGSCEASPVPKARLYITTYDWVKKGVWEHIDPTMPNLKFDSKQELIRECEKRGFYAKAFMKPKSQGKGFEHARRVAL